MPEPFSCPACGSADMQVFFELNQVPVHQNLLYSTETAAQNAARGDIRLGCCPACGFIANGAFDPDLLNYSEYYDNTQCYSPSFNDYMVQLATTLINHYNLHNKQIIEIGCGKGDFIKLLCNLGPNCGVGFDPSYLGELAGPSGCIQFVKDFYTEQYGQYRGDLYCSRHVIEHVPHPAEMFASLQKAVGGQTDAAIFFETPDVTWILRNLTFWDIFYEHCSLFSPGSIARLYARHGFDTTHLNTVFGGQYMWAEGTPSQAATGTIHPAVEDAATMFAHIDYFTANYRQKLDQSRDRIHTLQREGKKIVVWGAGAKGVTFLNLLDIQPHSLPYVVDINPRKQGKFMAGTGQRIVAPDFLASFKPDAVLVMNPNYADEIRVTLSTMSLSPELLIL
jgi:hypothetical protein